ncbi:MAG: hypothetical protein WCF85_21655 [Rhodospirillaceae bacterium]
MTEKAKRSLASDQPANGTGGKIQSERNKLHAVAFLTSFIKVGPASRSSWLQGRAGFKIELAAITLDRRLIS